MEQYSVTGMSCAACSARVERAVSAVEGVSTCSVNLLTNSMGVEGTASADAVIAAVRDAGYDASPKGASPATDRNSTNTNQDTLTDRETPALRRRLIASLGFLALLMYVSMGHTMWSWPLPAFFADNPIAIGLLQMILACIVMVINQKFFISGTVGLLHRTPNMDTLVALGSGAAFAYSTAVLFAMTAAPSTAEAAHHLHGLYFESAAMIVALITVGKMLEAHAKGKTTNALRSLMKLAPQTATLLREGKEVTLPASQVNRGDIFVVRPGESIPVDGTVLEGVSAVNESALTGESIPADKAPGDSVYAATLNQSGFLRCEATRVGEDTALSEIIRMVSDAAATKAPIAKIADRVSGIFVPAVMLVALVTTTVWLILGETVGYALARGISVLVISCPCALGLATPVAIMVGSGVGARNGILFKTAVSLEETGKADIVVLDKTGTITQGKPHVTDIYCSRQREETETLDFLTAVYSLESLSEHPLSAAIVEKAKEKGLSPCPVTDFRAIPGRGLQGCVHMNGISDGGSLLFGGNRAFVGAVCEIPADALAMASKWADEGKTPLFFAWENEFSGLIAVADVIKADSPAAIAALRNMGIRVVMLTGDNEVTARAIGAQVGVDEVIAGVLPDGKEAVIRDLQKQGKVAMVGDGINDAPALTRADIGIAIGAGTDVAIEAADVVLMHSRLSDVPAAIRLSRAALRNIKENLFWAFCYNIIGIPLAAGLFIGWLGWEMNPMFGAAAMSLSSFCVVTNALRLNLCRIHDASRDRSRHDKAVITTRTLHITGMMCGHCEASVKAALEALPAISAAAADHKSGTAEVVVSGKVSLKKLKKAVEKAGYAVTEIE
ncbi:MAG: heavy metal translocating P-type ATPase [Clostridia bacterium]|nr:heavy metal translocating P-type ATPase [Clostridia bacterium]